jgi:hypothetical protein
MVRVLRDFDPRVTALARPRSNCTVNYRPVISSERALQNNKLATVQMKFQGERKIGRESQMCLTPGQTGLLTVGRKLTSTSKSSPPIPNLSQTNSVHITSSRLSK